MTKPIHPVKKWTERKFSRKRLRRIALLKKEVEGLRHTAKWKPELDTFTIKELINGRRHLLNSVKNSGTLIFLGQGMRHLFETTRSLNEIEPAARRKKIRYVVVATRNAENEQEVNRLAEELFRRKIASKNKMYYSLIDYRAGGGSLTLMVKAIRKINPNASIDKISQDSIPVMIDIEDIPNPTKKDMQGKLSGGSEKGRAYQLWFEWELQKQLEKLKKEKQAQKK
ncbi:hypothetical protein KKG83_01355 [Candidatus Micrarchaeota archaeon]|nr:hypothetical protein [Candidatus Micrarchaeota archaeon]